MSIECRQEGWASWREISIFDTQFECLTIFDIQFDRFSKFDTKPMNFFNPWDSPCFPSFHFLYLFLIAYFTFYWTHLPPTLSHLPIVRSLCSVVSLPSPWSPCSPRKTASHPPAVLGEDQQGLSAGNGGWNRGARGWVLDARCPCSTS